METEILTEEQYKILSKKLLNTIERQYRIVPLNTLKHPDYFLKKPLYITIEIEKDTVIASLADTEFEAVNCLCGEIVDIYEDLKNDKENLGILPKKWLAFLEETIESR